MDAKQELSAKKEPWCQKLQLGAAELGVAVSEGQAHQCWDYFQLLVHWGARLDLTTVLEAEEVLSKHFLDSWVPASLLSKNVSILDVGSGAGFPGLALKIVRPDISLSSVDARAKKCVFQRQVVRELGLKEVEVQDGRMEALLKGDWQGRTFPVVMARALAPLGELVDLVGDVVAPGGVLVAYKGPRGEQEWAEAQDALEVAGLVKEDVQKVELPFSGDSRQILWLRKATD